VASLFARDRSMSLRMTDEQLADFKRRREKWEKPGSVKTHLIDTSASVAVEREKKNKYGNKKTELGGFHFASQREASRYGDLKLMEKAGEIHDLKRQVPFALVVNGYKVCTYIADFTYMENGKLVVNDAKGMKTSVYSIKKKLMKACLGIEIKET
jgi:hypothetical protein